MHFQCKIWGSPCSVQQCIFKEADMKLQQSQFLNQVCILQTWVVFSAIRGNKKTIFG